MAAPSGSGSTFPFIRPAIHETAPFRQCGDPIRSWLLNREMGFGNKTDRLQPFR
ncbi:ATP-dependent RNA helicase SrmB [Desmospora sp. 8437]|nr:ATP-dependent RNA helicase SrmB [Desmospora sp. 8437]